MTDNNPTEVSPDVQDLVHNYRQGTRESLDEAMAQIRAWLSNDEGEDSRTTLAKLSQARAKCKVKLNYITQDWVKFNELDSKTTAEGLQNEWIGMPFFSLPRQPGRRGKRMSGAVSTIARAELKNFLKFEVRFESWEELYQSEIISKDLPNISSKEDFLDAIAEMLEKSAAFDAEGEIQQLQQYADTIKRLLRVHGYDIKIKNPPDEDFSFYVAGTEEGQTAFIHGEAKRTDNLPDRIQPPGTSVELCWFGFASFVCKSPHRNSDLTAGLRNFLGIGEAPSPGDTSILHTECSSLVWNLIQGRKKQNNDDADRLKEVVPSIKKKLAQGQVDTLDALSIWGAVMQACFETIAKGKLYSIVMSLKMMWFVMLGLDDKGRCVVFITDGIKMGSEYANSDLLKFLSYAQDKTMDDEIQRKWQDALTNNNRKGQTKPPRSQQKRGGHLQSPNKQPRLNQERGGKAGLLQGGSHNMSLLSSQPNIRRAVSLDGLADVQGIDEYGIPIPYFDQIRDTVQDLGFGRCGTVRKVRWKNTFAALKRFRHKGEDDGRLPDDIYEHELSVLRSLRPLWGVHVPSLLFHKPWPSNPAIGLQVGEPMQENMDSWAEEERKRAALSLEKIRKFGWVQHDCRGSNFVRLTRDDGSWSIAAIDLENVVRCDD